MAQNYIAEFEIIVKELFIILNYSVEFIYGSRKRGPYGLLYTADMIAEGKERLYIDVKFYRTKNVSARTLKEMANQLALYVKSNAEGNGLIIINTLVPKNLREEIGIEYGLSIWDREILFSLMTKHSLELRDKFEHLLLAAQQGNETYDVFSGLTLQEPEVRYGHKIDQQIGELHKPKGQSLIEKLNGVHCGHDTWILYEKICNDILRYLFEDDLTMWDKQSRTDDGLSRFDLVCRIASNDDFWKALVSSFNSRFILFEFKNYCEKITQDQVYTTERYLYTKGLRSIGFIISPKGAAQNAVQAAKGALKENGKLIMFLSNEDLVQMLQLKDNLESCNDYLSSHLDNWLLSLSR